jgi:hypothetical protein
MSPMQNCDKFDAADLPWLLWLRTLSECKGVRAEAPEEAIPSEGKASAIRA